MNKLEFYEAKLMYEIDSWDLNEGLKKNENIVVIDTRSNEAYNLEHIPSAINIPHRTMNEENIKQLNKNTLYITYCDGIGCNASTKGALNLTKLGFNVKELLGGLDWWKRDGYSTDGIKGIDSKNTVCGC
ncbi:rhodanese-like domain-containing protein [Sulfurimonas sp.]|uniref:rhodanese-like domain-containing protein n=1 Tax=Sulfurimonas sp. TaxID=2022749 RepID=UPI003D112705